ncbi:MAG: hypothetical protein R3362_12620, partial [Rhodothermales bacterium]|nr:hypothetical protein [Rhodothermales bacterium]
PENAEQDGQKVCAFDLGESDPDVEVGTPSTFTLTIDDDDTPRLLVTEVMQNPAAVSDNDGEWFEVFNPNAAAIVLDGATVRDDGSNAFTVDDPSGADDYVVPPGGFFLFCDEPDPAVNGGVLGCDYDYAGFTLANGDDEIVIEQGGVEIARIAYDGGAVWPDPDGASMVYVGGRFGEDDDGTNWATAGAREQNAAGTAGFEDDPGGDLLPPGPTGDDGSPGLNGIHANLVSPFGVAVAAYCVATAGGSWSSAATWQNCSGGTPGAGDAAEIAGGTVTLSSPVGTVGAPVAVVVVDGGAALSVESDLYASVFTTAGATTVASVRGGGGSGLLVVGVDLSVSPSGSLTADGNVRLLPNSGNDACAADRADCVATITPEGGTTSGAVQMQREYVDTDADDPGAWRGIHAPLEGVPYADLADDFQVQGPDWSAFPDGTPNFYYYDNATEAFLPVGEGSGSATDPFDPDLGYLFYLFDFEVPGVWTVTGTPRESAPDLSLPYDAADANNFMWVGNVWAAPVDLVEQYAASTGIGATFRRFDPEVEGFAPYNAVTGVPGDSERYLAP